MNFKHLSKPLLLSALLLPLASFITINGQADEVAIPVGQQGADKASLDRPKAGMKMDIVEKKFGAPLNKSTAVGKPPISIWEYAHYNVYFESDHVIHSVLKPFSNDEAPAPVAAPSAPIVAAPVATVTPESAAPAPVAEPMPAPAPVVTEPAVTEPAAAEPIAAPAPAAMIAPETAPVLVDEPLPTTEATTTVDAAPAATSDAAPEAADAKDATDAEEEENKTK